MGVERVAIQIGAIWADFAARTVEIEFTEEFLARPLEEQAEAASALVEAALNEHIEAQDARIDALTAADDPPGDGQDE